MLELNFSPFPEIKTERLLLRRITDADAPELLFLRSDETVMKYIDREKPKSLEEALAFIQIVNANIDKNESVMWAIALQDKPDTLIGNIGFWRIINKHYRSEIGYMLHPSFWGKGIMKEALLAAIDFGFNQMKLHSIEAHINPDNTASGKLLEKTGFVREAYFKEDFFFRGKFIDSAIYSLLNK
ncbi:MAG: GNAT family N-acetyltransferase [Chitinophagaceae bacterium]|nr:GNAT family N-acetyltransferase [Chitinophagaceae bacterium]MBK8788543.1 GNAT family N-acetyltransferase [Chitinophagaceae bacterium]MBK9486593.1 GNAT family N-acetyltransferase [Chitinophagaceae bacterium]MBL0202030.1 GNAT family N-acetyltransferase [Chitinophagaceae bacterium]